MALFHLESLESTHQLIVCIRCSELIYRYRNETPCALLVHPRRWSWRSSFLRRSSPCSVCYSEPLTFILLQGTQLIETIRERSLLPTIRIHMQTSQPGICILLPQYIPMSNANFHKFPKRFKVCSSDGHLAQSFHEILHSCVPSLDILPRIRYTRFSIVCRSREPQKTRIFLVQVAVGAIFRMLGYSDGYDIRVLGVTTNDKDVHVGITRPLAVLLLPVHRYGR
jgi:hypothetical protein